MAKALRLSRAPSEIGDVARAIGLSEMIDHITIIGEAAVYAYECETAALLPREILHDRRHPLHQVFRHRLRAVHALHYACANWK